MRTLANETAKKLGGLVTQVGNSLNTNGLEGLLQNTDKLRKFLQALESLEEMANL
jgi:hypothetical protein